MALRDWPSRTGFYTTWRVEIRSDKFQGNAMTKFRKAAMGVAAAALLAGSQALAAGADMPLAPGKPAGVQQAQRHHRNLLLIGGISAIVVAAVAVAVANSDNASCSATNCPTTVATSTTG